MSQNAWMAALYLMGVSLLGQGCSPAAQSDDLSSLPSLLTGDYIGTSGSGEVYHSIVKLNIPQFGGEVYYHHISLDSLRGPVFQRKVYRFDESGNRMRSTVLLGPADGFSDEQALAERLNELPEESLLRFPDACQFRWSRTEGGYTAVVHRERCSYESPAFGGLVSPEMTYLLSECGLLIQEGIFREDNTPVFPPSNTDNRRANAKTGDCN